MEASTIDFKKFLLTCFENGEYATDDVIAFVMPLFEEVLSLHNDGLVAPFSKQETLFITDNRLDIDENLAHAPLQNLSKIKPLFKDYESKGFVVTDESKVETKVDEGHQEHTNLNIHLDLQKPLRNPAYLLGYRCYEEVQGHHDALTDIFCLGLILGSMALNLDLYDEDDLKTFVDYRTNPVYYNNRIHPTISALITEMTELDRRKRCCDLYDAINRLVHYRDFDPEKQTDLSNIAGWVNKEISTRSQFILNKLRTRLFDTSRRNRLLYYKSNNRFVNLTVSSVPMVLHYQSINPSMLFTWNDDISSKVKGMKEISLNKYLRFEDHQYISSQLDRIKTEAQRDVNEYGFSQLKLVVAFLNWHNLKESKDERIQSPLLLIPVEIKKRKALKEDQFTLQVLDNVAEVNPVLSNYLRELYGIKLPDFIDFDEMTLPQFYDLLKKQIDSVNQGIQLNYIDKPRIKLIHTVAKQTVNNYKKRLRKSGKQLGSYRNIEYSYKPEHYKPLGLEIFRQRIEQHPSVLEFLVNEDVKASINNLTGDETSKERKLYQLQDSESNPYSWDVDTCNMVLGNFNYKKMSLVRDYNYVADEKIEHAVFEKLFSDKPKTIDTTTYSLNNPAEWFHVVTADPTQTKAILQSRSNESYIIQGPPGTGKSQTITNLIADFIAQGKNILFVCEKRAALDVVYQRLKQQQLDELCCYIHDSQGDKRKFIENLKATYEDFVKNKMNLPAITIQRNNSLQKLQEQLQMLELFHSTNNDINDKAGIRIRELIEKLISLKPFATVLSAQQQELLPHYESWLSFGETIKQLSSILEETGAEPAFAEHPLSKLNDTVFLHEQPINLLQNLLQTAKRLLTDIDAAVTQNNIPAEHAAKLSSIKNLVQDAVLLEPLATTNNLQLVDTNNKESKAFEKEIKQYRSLQKKYEASTAKNNHWKNKFSEQDTITALAIAAKNEKSFFSFLNGSWRKLKKQLMESYDFSQHQVKPSYSSVLQQLMQEQEDAKQTNAQRQSFVDNYGIDNIETTYLGIEKLRSKQGDKEVDFLLAHNNANHLVVNLCKLNNTLHLLEVQLQQSIAGFSDKDIQQLKDEMDSISMNLDSLQELLPSLQNFAQLPEQLKNAIKNIPLTPKQAEASIAFKTWQHLLQSAKPFSATDAASIEATVSIIQKEYKKLLQLNAQFIRAGIRKKFAQNVELAMMAPSQLNAEQKEFKKKYNEGRKILENEFSKSMRYKSIRELSAKESGLVLKDIKPVWLMSPLSVSDSLPVDVNYFDVVIFDEASQITLEEGIPSLYRAKQSIIVGDEMQMPPTNFFTAKAEDPDDLETFGSDDEEILSADADSLLTQGSRKLSSVMLGWHYRSRYETLISYSNHAFYSKGLLTIPDKTIHHNSRNDIIAENPEDGSKNVEELLSRSISYHYLPNSVYEQRSNYDEAYYIAHLVKELLQQKTGNSIGIVAFSQEQQHQIEDALTALATSDKQFEEMLEAEYTRTDDEQFVGLIVKNLENIQGDERDIIIMSVCYGFDERKKMLMNFGPINKKGGEKRLNVIFSRAKKHMAIISSIKQHNITNEYNEGANYFKRFLHYAEMVSAGNMQTARIILDGLVNNKPEDKLAITNNYLLLQIQKELEVKGYETHLNIGQSTFKCSLAVKKNKDDDAYTLGVVIDDENHYLNENWLEQYFQRPAILQSFGWKVIAIFAKDWLQQPQKTIEQIIKKLLQEPVEEKEEELPTNNELEPDSLTVQPIESPIMEAASELAFIKLVSTENGSNKFWEAACDGNKLVVRFGKIGTKGQTQVKTFADYESTEKERQKLVTEKLAKGYYKI